MSAVLVVVAATGSALVFRSCARETAPTAPVVAQPLGLEALLARARAEANEAPITDITLPEEADEPWVFYVDDASETALYLAGDGALLARRPTKGGLMQLLFKLHTGEIVGLPGQGAALLGGLGLLALIASGLAMIASRRGARR